MRKREREIEREKEINREKERGGGKEREKSLVLYRHEGRDRIEMIGGETGKERGGGEKRDVKGI